MLALPFIVMGGTPFAPLAAAEAGGDVQATLAPWFLPILVTGAATFAAGGATRGTTATNAGCLMALAICE